MDESVRESKGSMLNFWVVQGDKASALITGSDSYTTNKVPLVALQPIAFSKLSFPTWHSLARWQRLVQLNFMFECCKKMFHRTHFRVMVHLKHSTLPWLPQSLTCWCKQMDGPQLTFSFVQLFDRLMGKTGGKALYTDLMFKVWLLFVSGLVLFILVCVENTFRMRQIAAGSLMRGSKYKVEDWWV